MSKVKVTGLGKGFGSLLPDDFDKSLLLDKKDRVQKISIKKIKTDPNQPRKHFDEDSLSQLSQSIKTYGILQPIVVMPEGDNFVIIAGERRYRAAKMAGLEFVPVLSRSSEELERLEIGLVENVQRVDLSPLEQAVSIAKLNEQFNLSYQEIGKRLGKANTTITNIVRLLKLPKNATEALRQAKISEGHARTILSLAGDDVAQQKLLDQIIKNGWSVRKSEEYVLNYKKSKKEKILPSQKDTGNELSEKLSKKLNTKVVIKESKKSGEIKISFKNQSQLNNILQQLLS